MQTYSQFNKTERMELAILLSKSYPVLDTAGQLGYHRSTVYRELQRNRVSSSYHAAKAEHKHYVRRKASK